MQGDDNGLNAPGKTVMDDEDNRSFDPTTNNPGDEEEPFVWDAENVAMIGSIGALFYQRGDYRRAEAVFETLAALAPHSADAFAALGAVKLAMKKLDEALEKLNEALRLNDRMLEAYVSRAEVFLRLQRHAEADADIRRTLKLDPEQKTVAAKRAALFAAGLEKTFERLARQTAETT